MAKCLLCRIELSADGAKKIWRKALRVIAVCSVVFLVVILAGYYYVAMENQSHDIPVRVQSNLKYSIYYEPNNTSKGVVVVYGNITNDNSFKVDIFVDVVLNYSGNSRFINDLQKYYIDHGETLQFDRAYQFEDLYSSPQPVGISVQAWFVFSWF
jgi:hypothetical protein